MGEGLNPFTWGLGGEFLAVAAQALAKA